MGSKSYSPAGGGLLEAKMSSELANLRLEKQLLEARKVPELGSD